MEIASIKMTDEPKLFGISFFIDLNNLDIDDLDRIYKILGDMIDKVDNCRGQLLEVKSRKGLVI